jgi:hypothetical protein
MKDLQSQSRISTEFEGRLAAIGERYGLGFGERSLDALMGNPAFPLVFARLGLNASN